MYINLRQIIIIFFILISGYSSAQFKTWAKGNIYLKNGETVSGLIKLPVHAKGAIAVSRKKVIFKTNENSKKKSFEQEKVEKVVFNTAENEEVVYKYFPISKKKYHFFKIELVGDVTLLSKPVSIVSREYDGLNRPNGKLYISKQVLVSDYYILKKGENIAQVISKVGGMIVENKQIRRKRLLKHLSNCQSAVKLIKETKFWKKKSNEQIFKSIIEEYNSSCGSSS